MVVYGGDEVNAIVLDVGSHTTRAGYAGEDAPKTVIPTSYGYIEPNADQEQARFFCGHAGPSVYRGAEQQIHNPMKDSIVADWNAAERLIERTLAQELRLDRLAEQPLLASEPAWNSKTNRERMIELAFEGYETPAFYSVDRSVLASFSTGKGTALVVDVGEQSTSVIPVHDGFVLRKGIHKSPICGSFVSSVIDHQLRHLTNDPNRPFQPTPQYLVKSKSGSDNGQPRPCVLYDNRPAHPTYDAFARLQVLSEFKESVCAVLEAAYNDPLATSKGSRQFEFPDGAVFNFGPRQRFLPYECFYRPKEIIAEQPTLPEPTPSPDSTIATPSLAQTMSLPDMIVNAIRSADPDVMAQLSSNIVVVGGTTLTQGFIERLQSEVVARMQGIKIKINAPGNSVERKYASWLGGSILASLGTFHQLWISRSEYAESGKSIIHRRAK